jgi:Ca2+/Na+ antiporter
MNNELTTKLKKITLPAILILSAIFIIIVGKNTNQDSMFTMAGLFLMLAGLVALFFLLSNRIAKLALIIGGVMGIAGLFIYLNIFNEVKTTKDNRAMDVKMDELIKQNLTDVKTAQIAYKEVNGAYAKDFDALKDFIVNGKIKFVVKTGGVPNRRLQPEERAILYGAGDRRALDYNMTEIEALKLAKSSNSPSDLKNFVRDTLSKSFYDETFASKNYLSRRKKMGFPDFNVDSLFYVPNTGRKFEMTVKDSVEYQGAKIQAIVVETFKVSIDTGDTLRYKFGDLASPALTSDWD